MKIIKLLNVKNITVFLFIAAAYFLYLLSFSSFELYKIDKFNETLKKGEAPQQFEQGYEARFSTAFQIAKKGHFKEATILFNNLSKAKKAYEQSLAFNNNHWDVKHNLDRVLTMLPKDPTPGIGDSDSPGLIMGNIPVGLP